MNILTKKRSSLTGSTPHRQTTTHENSNSAEKGREDPDPNIVRVSRPAIVRRMADFLEYPGFVTLVQGQKVKVRAHRDGTVTFDDELMAVERTMIEAFHNRERIKDNDVVKLWTTEEGESVFSSLALSRSGRQIQYFIVVQFVQ